MFKVDDRVECTSIMNPQSSLILGKIYTVTQVLWNDYLRLSGERDIHWTPNQFTKLVPHVHCDLIIEWAHGAVIEFEIRSGNWADASTPSWREDLKYRVKPETTPKEHKILKIELEMRKLADELKEITND